MSHELGLSGQLVWGVKSGFREYVAAVTDGAESTTDGVRTNESGAFVFSLDDATSLDNTSGHGTLKFRGSVVFSAYHGILLVRVRDPWITLDGDGGTVSIMHPAYREPTSERQAIGTFDGVRREVVPGAVNWSIDVPRMTYEGTQAFGDVYPVDAPFDPIVITLAKPGPRAPTAFARRASA
ncbi:HtaA domain-containing protein [Streptomyces arenae]|uniref:HtaA domain-containing protein n=1 Tax=Streptomyces arenae TaxID=29301 RepID=UPI002659EB36|nr:HtaA domain-containing protein [Streptomyces arenae]MCG7207378.1 HtaA domain-containing protein [Streptomyces arenae]